MLKINAYRLCCLFALVFNSTKVLCSSLNQLDCNDNNITVNSLPAQVNLNDTPQENGDFLMIAEQLEFSEKLYDLAFKWYFNMYLHTILEKRSNTMLPFPSLTNINEVLAFISPMGGNRCTTTQTRTLNGNVGNQSAFNNQVSQNPNVEKPYRCFFCVKSFPSLTSLKIHIRTHTGEKPYKCKFCDQSFKANHNKTRHERIHQGEKPFKCTICQKGFTSKVAFDEHCNKHKGKKPYKCTQCTKAYATKHGLKYHVKTHSRERSYQCNYCSATFTHISTYRAHIRYEESTDEDPKCDICERVYTNKYHLANHNKKMHPNNK